MKKSFKALFLILIFLMQTTPIVAFASQNTLYVSADGNDVTGNGTEALPYASLKKAVESASENSTIIVKEGTYFLDFPVDITKENNNLQIRNEGNVVFTGAKKIDYSDFKLVKDPETLKKLQKSVRGRVYELSLSEYGISAEYGLNKLSNTGFYDFPRLYVNGALQNEARYPNKGYLTAVNKGSKGKAFTCEDERIKMLSSSGNAFLTGSFRAEYHWERGLASADGEGNVNATGKFPSVRDGAEWYISNVIEEIDAVGEYCVDFEKQLLYCCLPENYKTSDLEISTPCDYSLITINGAENISIEGIKFEKFSDRIFEIKNSKTVTVKNCTFDYIDADFVIWAGNYLTLMKNSAVTVSGNTAYGCTGSFMTFSGGDRDTLTPGNIIIENNLITNFGSALYLNNQVIMCGIGAPNLLSDSVGNAVRNNVIGNCANVGAILAIGNDIDISGNEIYNIGEIVYDGGAIYVGKSSTKYGVEIHDNYIHDLNKNKVYSGVYSDDGYCGVSVYHNVFKDMRYPIHIGMGMNNKFNDNIAIDTVYGILAQSRMHRQGIFSDTYNSTESDWSLKYEAQKLFENEEVKNVFLKSYPEMDGILDRTPFFAPWKSEIVGNVNIGTANYAVQEIPKHRLYKYDDDTKSDAVDENGNKIYTVPEEANISDGTNSVDIVYTDNTNEYVDEIKTYGGKYENNTKLENAQFKDPSNQNYSLVNAVENSTVNEIDMEKIGIDAEKNPNAFSKAEFDFNVIFSDNKFFVSIEKGKNLSEYEIYVNNELYGAYTDNTLDSAYEIENIEAGREYNVKIIAKGIARQNMFEKEVSKNIVAAENNSLEFAKSLLNEELQNVKSEKYEYSLEITDEQAEEILNSGDETQIYDFLSNIISSRSNVSKFLSCEAELLGSLVTITAEGYEPKSDVTVFVTNPTHKISDEGYSGKKETIRYADVIKADCNGKIDFTFDTKSNGIDMLGTYNVFLSSADGKKTLEKSYTYATVEASDVVCKKDGETVTDLSLYKGQKLTAEIQITNRTDKDRNAFACLGLYSDNRLLDADVKNTVTLEKNHTAVLTFEFEIPESCTDDCKAEIFVWDGTDLLKPLTTKKIFE